MSLPLASFVVINNANSNSTVGTLGNVASNNTSDLTLFASSNDISARMGGASSDCPNTRKTILFS